MQHIAEVYHVAESANVQKRAKTEGGAQKEGENSHMDIPQRVKHEGNINDTLPLIEVGRSLNAIIATKLSKDNSRWTTSDYLTDVDNPYFPNSLVTSNEKEERY